MPGPTVNTNSPNIIQDKRPKPATDGVVPRAPKWLSTSQKKIYKDTARKIVQLGIGASCDENILSLFALQMDRLILLNKSADKADLSSARMMNDLTSQVLSLSREIGLTPSARAKMRIVKMETNNPLNDLLNEED